MTHHLSNEVLVLSGDDVRRLLPMERCIELVATVMQTVSRGGAQLPLRIGVHIQGGNIVATMPGAIDAPAAAGAKVIAVFPQNSRAGLPSHRGVVILFDSEFGAPLAILDATAITALRTAAASAVATNVLARADGVALAILGNGEQAAMHLRSMSMVRQLKSVTIWGRDIARAREFARREAANLDVPLKVATSVQDAVRDADIVCTTTSAREPILQGGWLRAGAHVNLVGASAANAREADDALVRQASFYVDYRASALAQAGELLHACGEQAAEHIRGEIGEVLLGRLPGRVDPAELTVYKSLGIAAQDLAAAHHVYHASLRSGGGTRVLI